MSFPQLPPAWTRVAQIKVWKFQKYMKRQLDIRWYSGGRGCGVFIPWPPQPRGSSNTHILTKKPVTCGILEKIKWDEKTILIWNTCDCCFSSLGFIQSCHQKGNYTDCITIPRSLENLWDIPYLYIHFRFFLCIYEFKAQYRWRISKIINRDIWFWQKMLVGALDKIIENTFRKRN